MPCGQEMWIQARNFTDACNHPPIVHCVECRAGICSAHIIECDECGYFVCRDCVREHAREHERRERQLLRAS